jgi:pimeloyl-ACP methyl ester carboxylesterase
MGRFVRSARRWIAPALIASATGCAVFFPAPAPLRMSWARCERCGPGRGLMVFLPGRSSDAKDFVDNGFVDDLSRSGLAVDSVAVDATLGYYMRRTLITRLAEDVLGPARSMGYRRIWLAGISMGGLGAVLTAEQHANELDGILLMAPFLGDDDVIEEIASQGGLAGWAPPLKVDPEDYQRNIWRWLKRYTKPQTSVPSLYLGFGDEDRFAKAGHLLAAVLPADHVLRVRGRHTWGPWREVFAAFLRSGALSNRTSAAQAVSER